MGIASSIEQMRNLAFVLRLTLGDRNGPPERSVRELLGEIDGLLVKLAALAEGVSPGSWAEGSSPSSSSSRTLPSCDLAQVLEQTRERHLRLFEPEIRFVQESEARRAIVPLSSRQAERLLLDLLVRVRDAAPEGSTVTLRLEARDTFVRISIEPGAAAGEPSPPFDLRAFWSRAIGSGNLILQSRPGRGACFVLTLPALVADAARSRVGQPG